MVYYSDSHGLLEVDGVLPRHSSVLGLALDVDDLVLGQPQPAQHGVPANIWYQIKSNRKALGVALFRICTIKESCISSFLSPDEEAEPELALLLALPHAALLQLAQLHQVHPLQRRARDLSTKY